ncbi:Ppx/GppA phosphatase family protein [Listeria ilorinensis]|uniref:Ppx/GppA phosphatase family protein n=1 Tax=Listeria ilorinensis TaxID=2867439 RepID=UPI001EF57036|nr:exopolyphosphatase [Listeria ilorinensis]
MVKPRLFAAVTIGSQSVTLKIMDISRQEILETLRSDVSIGTDIYNHKTIAASTMHETSTALAGFVQLMRDYDVTEYRVVATSSVREALNAEYVKEQIRLQTGLEIAWVSNAQERFLHSQAAAQKTPDFSQLISEGTMLIDIGSGSIQLTVYDEGEFMFSRNIKLGPLRVRELLAKLKVQTSNFADLLEDFIFSKIRDYAQFAPKDVAYKHFILIGTDLLFFKQAFMGGSDDHQITRDYFDQLYGHMLEIPEQVLAKRYQLSYDAISQLLPSAMLLKELLKVTKAESILLSDAELIDGILVEASVQHKKIKLNHDFNEDLLASAEHISRRYMTDQKHSELVRKFALHLFNQLKPLHGLKKRERLLLELAAILQDIGSFIDMNNHYIHSDYLIEATELIGLSEEEQKIVAAVARYHSTETPSSGDENFDRYDTATQLTIAKLTAILRIADALDDSHQQKVERIAVSLKKEQLQISVWANDDLMLEKWTFNEKAEFFAEVYGLKPQIIEKGGLS